MTRLAAFIRRLFSQKPAPVKWVNGKPWTELGKNLVRIHIGGLK